MRGAVPLFVDVFVAPLASLRLHEIFRGNVFSVFGLRGTREKFAGGTVALTIHRFWRHFGICYAVAVLPGNFSHPPGAGSDGGQRQSQGCEACCSGSEHFAKPAAPSEPGTSYNQHTDGTEHDVEIKPTAQAVRRADLDQREAEQSSSSDEKPTDAKFPGTIAKDLPQNRDQQNGEQDSGASMKENAATVNN